MSDEQREPGFYWVHRHYGPPEVCKWAETNAGPMKWAKPGFELAINDDDMRLAVKEIGPRVQTPDEIAAAIAAARADGVRIGVGAAAKAIRESKIEYGGDVFHAETFYSISEACREHYADVVDELPLSTNATAILAAERAAGREEMRKACIKLVRETNMVDSDPEGVADEISALVLA